MIDTSPEYVARCPKCMDRADKIDSVWACSAGCDLTGYRQCEGCQGLYRSVFKLCPQCKKQKQAAPAAR
jgi:hypothetical protein